MYPQINYAGYMLRAISERLIFSFHQVEPWLTLVLRKLF